MKIDDTKLIFYDFEVFKDDWLVVFEDARGRVKCIKNDRDELYKMYKKAQENNWIFVGYNSKNYDQYIMKSILAGMNPKTMNDWIIVQEKQGWQFPNKELRKYPVNNFDCMIMGKGLKTLEGFQGHDIKETDVSFDIDRKLTEDELLLTELYCRKDVHETKNVFYLTKENFDAIKSLIEEFDLDISDINKTKSRLAEKILDCEKREYDDEFDFPLVDFLDLGKYQNTIDGHFLDYSNRNYNTSLTTMIAGLEHKLGWGGIHAGLEKCHISNDNEYIIHDDVGSMYPSIMIEWNMMSRNFRDPQKYIDIYHKRLHLKALGLKKEQAPYKIVLNGTYGISKDKTSNAYDPMQANAICVNGQRALVDLICHLEDNVPGFKLINSNTDGIIYSVPKNDESLALVDKIRKEWEARTKLSLSTDFIRELWQKDVNNYIFQFENDKFEMKGAYLKALSEIDNDLPIINKAIKDYIVSNIPIEETINNCNELMMFQKIVHVSSQYEYALKNCSFGPAYIIDHYKDFPVKGPDGKLLKDANGKRIKERKYVMNDLKKVLDDCNITVDIEPYNSSPQGVSQSIVTGDPDSLMDFISETKNLVSKTKTEVWNHDGERMIDKTFRVFASKDLSDGGLFKFREGENPNKFADTAEHVFIDNSDVTKKAVPEKLDREWYIEQTKARLKKIGFEVETKNSNLNKDCEYLDEIDVEL